MKRRQVVYIFCFMLCVMLIGCSGRNKETADASAQENVEDGVKTEESVRTEDGVQDETKAESNNHTQKDAKSELKDPAQNEEKTTDDVKVDSSDDVNPDPEFSFKDRTFIVDGFEIDVTQFAPAATAIMDAKRVGDWIIVECHNNPNIGTYLFYNIPNGISDYFEYQIDGANLIYQGEDLSTAVYQQYNEIFDIWGHEIGYIQEGELYELSFKNENTIAAKCWIIDDAGEEKEFVEEFEYEPCDGAVWAYYEYMLGGEPQWERLKKLAGDASALIMLDIPEIIRDRMPYPVTVEEGALDTVAVVPLIDDSKIGIGSIVEPVKKGDAVVFEVTAPEGMPVETITVETPRQKTAQWEVGQLSGRIPQMSTFIKP